jgi:hypothetical protein
VLRDGAWVPLLLLLGLISVGIGLIRARRR